MNGDAVLLGFGQVLHTRHLPAKHAFAYKTWFTLLPMHALHSAAERCGLAVNVAAAISFHDQDHGDGRGPENGGALAWMREVLQDHGLADAGAQVWLQCFPRVLGYAFKPVSFWYCHGADGTLRAVLAEVNNTFGERHCYLLNPVRTGHPIRADKAFHVSPFFDVAGSYCFRFMHSEAQQRNVVRIEHQGAEGRLLTTSWSGHLRVASPALLRHALWAYPAMTLMVTLRIHWQALQLLLRRVGLRHKPAAPGHLITPAQRGAPTPAQ